MEQIGGGWVCRERLMGEFIWTYSQAHGHRQQFGEGLEGAGALYNHFSLHLLFF